MRGFDARIDSADGIARETIESLLDHGAKAGRWLRGLTLGVALIVGGWFAARSLPVRALFPDYATARGAQRTVTLADGSVLTIDTDAALDFDLGDDGRRVTLFQGQIRARVTPDTARPFVVETRDGTAMALGTAFTVRRDEDATIVTVLQSRVRACPTKAPESDCADLAPGDQVRMVSRNLEHLARVDPETAAIWAEGWLAADDRPVADILRELNRYRYQAVRFDPAALAGIRVSGSFPLRDPDRALRGILQSTGLRLSRSGDGDLLVYRGE